MIKGSQRKSDTNDGYREETMREAAFKIAGGVRAAVKRNRICRAAVKQWQHCALAKHFPVLNKVGINHTGHQWAPAFLPVDPPGPIWKERFSKIDTARLSTKDDWNAQRSILECMRDVASTRPETILAEHWGDLPTSWSSLVSLVKTLDLEKLQGPDQEVYFDDHVGRVLRKMKTENVSEGTTIQFKRTMEAQRKVLETVKLQGRPPDFHADRKQGSTGIRDGWTAVGSYETGLSHRRYGAFGLFVDLVLLLHRGGELYPQNRQKLEGRLALYLDDSVKFLNGLDEPGRIWWRPFAQRIWSTMHAYQEEAQLIQVTKLAHFTKNWTYALDMQNQYLNQFIRELLGKPKDMKKLMPRFAPSDRSKIAREAWDHLLHYPELSIGFIWD